MANSINATSTGNGGIITTGDDSGVLNIQTNETTAMSVDASQSVDFVNNIDAPNTFGFKNRIINGGMTIDQRNAGASVTPTNGAYTLDRYMASLTQASKFSVQQSTTAPAPFKNSLLVTSLSAFSVGSGDVFSVNQFIEGLNTYDIGWGTAAAVPVSLSFWVRSSVTGTFPISVQNYAQTYTYLATYTIAAANTWQYVTVNIPAQTSGVWATDTSTSIMVRFVLGSGSTYSTSSPNSWQAGNYWTATGCTNIVATNGATFYITGVQIEKGTQATSFDFRSYGTELALCQRYYYRVSTYTLGYTWIDSISYSPVIKLPVTMRSTPTLDASGNSFSVQSGSAGTVGLGAGGGYFQSSADQVTIRNSASNWSIGVGVAVTAGFGAEL